ncbi:uncharacterized protein LOC118755857, partial [Rhagoletis pomonella]|uniref:uncharacterized protein LOC118755857 n=1 Tax=Rhagoletis pomonella TaxID=28610 RepID=UPI00178156E3
YDSASVEISEANSINENVSADEIKNYISGRYVGSTEAAWRILEYEIHQQSHTIYRLDIHLPNRQTVIFREGQEQNAIHNLRNTKLLAFFELNRVDTEAHQYLYTEIPQHYIWNTADKKWKKRTRGGDKCFEDLKTCDNVIYNTFVEACHARGIASDDSEWKQCLDEAMEFQSPKQIRELFATIFHLPENRPEDTFDPLEEQGLFIQLYENAN